jgi:hypothetical protein
LATIFYVVTASGVLARRFARRKRVQTKKQGTGFDSIKTDCASARRSFSILKTPQSGILDDPLSRMMTP